MNNKSYYAIIPADVRYSKEIPDGAKLLYGEITALANENGYCWATNKYFAELYGKSVDTVGRWISELAKAGFIYTLIDKESGNSRKIWLCSAQGATGKNADRVPAKIQGGYRQKYGEATGKNAVSIKENNTMNNTLNTTTNKRGKIDAAGGVENFPLNAEISLVDRKVAPAAEIPPAAAPSFRPLDIDTEIARLSEDALVVENFRRRCRLPAEQFPTYVSDFTLHIKSLQKTYSNPTELRGHFYNWCDTHKSKTPQRPAGLPRDMINLSA